MTSGVSNMLKLLFPFTFAQRFVFLGEMTNKTSLIRTETQFECRVEKHEEYPNIMKLKWMQKFWKSWIMDDVTYGHTENIGVVPHSGRSEGSPYAISIAFV